MNLAKKVEDLEAMAQVKSGENYTVYGFVCPKNGLTHCITNKSGQWENYELAEDEEPTVYLAAKLEKAVTSTKRYVVIIGGRGSSKSIGAADIDLADAKDTGAKTYFLREYQSSIEHSVHSLLKDEISRLGFEGFRVQDRRILYNGKTISSFAGISRNVDSIKSAHGFKRFSVEEAQFISKDSLKALTPTARKKPKKGLPTKMEEVTDDPLSNVQLQFIANPSSSEDPFSQRFIVPFKTVLDRDGIYEDDLHLIIKMNYDDNPWFAESGLEEERAWDEKNLPAALYAHIWLGEFNDSVENALIMMEWFNACIDAHIKKNFKVQGIRKASHDPSDVGNDPKGYAEMHGVLVTRVEENPDGDVNEGGDWAANMAIANEVETFIWDVGGMGITLNRQFSEAFHNKKVSLSQFNGGGEVENKDAIYGYTSLTSIQNQKKWGEVCKNLRAQCYLKLRERIYKTYRYVMFNEHCDVEDLISFDSNIECLNKLRSELCRMPVKDSNSGMFELYTKKEMASKFGLASPNLGDSVMMLMKMVSIINNNKPAYIPKPLPTMGRR